MAQSSVTYAIGAAIAGQLADSGRDINLASYASAEASAEMPLGVMVMQGTGDAQDLLLTAGSVATCVGVTVWSAAFQVANELGATGLKPTVMHNVMKRGRIWVLCEEAVTPASAVRVRCTTAGNGQGSFRTSSAGSGLSMLLVGARYLDTAAIGGLSRVELDVLGRDRWTAD